MFSIQFRLHRRHLRNIKQHTIAVAVAQPLLFKILQKDTLVK